MCQSDTIPVKETGGEGTFILTELGTSGCVHSVTSINKVILVIEIPVLVKDSLLGFEIGRVK